MKRLILAALAACLLFPGLSKAQGRHEVNIMLGGYNTMYATADVMDDVNYQYFYSALDLFDIYEPQYRYETGPVLTLSYGYSPLRWLSVGAQMNYGNVKVRKWRVIDSAENQNYNMETFSLLPQVKFRIPSAKHFRLYAKLAAGARYIPGQGTSLAYDIVPIGFEWAGQFFYGTAELANGNIVRGGRIGIGFRF